MSRVTGLQYVDNQLDVTAQFENKENSGNNRTIPGLRQVGVGNAWIPWRVNKDEDMKTKRMVITLKEGGTFYFWQHKDHIRYAKDTDPMTPDGGSIMPGESGVASSKNITITQDGDLFMEPA